MGMKVFLIRSWVISLSKACRGNELNNTLFPVFEVEGRIGSTRELPIFIRSINASNFRIETPPNIIVPPANRLEALRGSRKGQHRIRINDQWRIGFVWMDGDAVNVEIVDCH
jgi:proteic killer suppression protein